MKLTARTLLSTLITCGLAGCSQTSQHRAEVLQPAVDSISRLTASNPDVETGISVARVQEQQGQLREARERLDELAGKAPDHPLIQHRLAVVTSKLGEYEAANQHFAAALKQQPHNAELLADYGFSLMLQNEMDEAEVQLRKALQESPGDKRSLNNLALVTGYNGRFDESYELFRKVGGESSAWMSLGYVHSQRGDGPKATECFSKALSLDDKLEPAAEALVQIAELQKQPRSTPAPEPVVHADHAVNTPANSSLRPHVIQASAVEAKAVPEFVRNLKFDTSADTANDVEE